MKKIILSLIVLTSSISALHAQNNMVIHQGNGSTLSLPLQSVDSVRFNLVPPPAMKRIFQNNGNILSLSVTDIDSITYTIPNRSTLPTITTQAVTVLSSSSAFGGGNISADGGSAVTQRGVCWNTSPNPTIANNFTVDGTGLGSYGSTMQPLSPATTYYVRAYATNSNGTSYGSQVSFVTATANNSGNMPTVVSENIQFVKYFGLVSGGNVTNDGGLAVTSRGVCWAIGTTPTINHSRTIDGAGFGDYISGLQNLLPNTQYFIRAYATNDAGTSYGNSYAFNTADFPELFLDSFYSFEFCRLDIDTSQTVYGIEVSHENPIFNIQTLSANVIMPTFVLPEGIVESGLVFSKTFNPSISDKVITEIEEFYLKLNRPLKNGINCDPLSGFTFTKFRKDSVVMLRNLELNTLYFVRYFAKNSKGVIYSKNYSFKTLDGKVVIDLDTTNSSSRYITSTTGVLSYNIIENRGAIIEETNICYSENPNPTIDDYKSINLKLQGNGLHSELLLNLLPNKKYYYRAFAKTNFGLYYSQADSFTTPGAFMFKESSDVSYNGHLYKTIKLGNGQEWFKENLKTSSFSNGDPIPNYNDIDSWSTTINSSWVYYNNDSTFEYTYGKLYNYYTIIDNRNVCPSGWHVPDHDDVVKLLSYIFPFDIMTYIENGLVKSPYAGFYLKDNGSLWTNDVGSSNESGLSFLPSGLRLPNGNFSSLNNGFFLWSSQNVGPSQYLAYRVVANSHEVREFVLGGSDLNYGLSIRCIKD